MKKEDMNTIELLLEAVGIVIVLLYSGLQIYYGIYYGAGVAGVTIQIFLNVAAILLAYTGLTLLQCHPERVNGLTQEACTPDIKKYTIRMLRLFKLIFVGSLCFTSILDVMGKQINTGYSMVVVVLIVLTALYYEYKIFRILKERRK